MMSILSPAEDHAMQPSALSSLLTESQVVRCCARVTKTDDTAAASTGDTRIPHDLTWNDDNNNNNGATTTPSNQTTQDPASIICNRSDDDDALRPTQQQQQQQTRTAEPSSLFAASTVVLATKRKTTQPLEFAKKRRPCPQCGQSTDNLAATTHTLLNNNNPSSLLEFVAQQLAAQQAQLLEIQHRLAELSSHVVSAVRPATPAVVVSSSPPCSSFGTQGRGHDQDAAAPHAKRDPQHIKTSTLAYHDTQRDVGGMLADTTDRAMVPAHPETVPASRGMSGRPSLLSEATQSTSPQRSEASPRGLGAISQSNAPLVLRGSPHDKEGMVLSRGNDSLPAGVWYDRVENRYVVQCNETTACGRKKRRYFGVSRYGEEGARRCAIRERLRIVGLLPHAETSDDGSECDKGSKAAETAQHTRLNGRIVRPVESQRRIVTAQQASNASTVLPRLPALAQVSGDDDDDRSSLLPSDHPASVSSDSSHEEEPGLLPLLLALSMLEDKDTASATSCMGAFLPLFNDMNLAEKQTVEGASAT